MLRNSLARFGMFLTQLAPEAPAEAAPAQRSRQTHARGNRFDRRVRELSAAKERKIVAGSVQLVGMDEIKNSLGSLWENVAGKAYNIAERVIRKNLSEDDVFERKEGGVYVLCFANLSKAEAETRTKQIVSEIRSALSREAPDTGGLRVDHFVAELDWEPSDEDDELPLAEVLAEALRKVRQEAEEASKSWRRALLRDALVIYSPIWQPDRKAVSGYRCIVDETTGKNALRQLATVSSPEEVRSALADLDCLILSRAVEGLHSLLQESGKAQLFIPVSYYTINDKAHREMYFSLCNGIPEPYRQFIVLEMHGTAAGAPVSRIVELALLLKRYTHAVVVEAQAASPRLLELGTGGIFAISVNAAGLGGTPSELTSQLARYATIAKSANLKLVVHGADTVGLADAAEKVHADYISGKAVAPVCDKPKTAYHWALR